MEALNKYTVIQYCLRSSMLPLLGDKHRNREICGNTVDGRNPAPVDMVNIPLFTAFYTSQVVVGDFFHQQYFHVP